MAEILVVLVIVALASAVILMSTSNMSPSKSIQRLANQLHSYLTVVQEQAILKPGIFGLFMSDEGYTVLELNTEANTWDVPEGSHANFWRPKIIARDVEIELTVNSRPTVVPQDLSQVTAPQIVFLPSGEITPFNMIIRNDDKTNIYRLKGNFAGTLVVSKVEQ